MAFYTNTSGIFHNDNKLYNVNTKLSTCDNDSESLLSSLTINTYMHFATRGYTCFRFSCVSYEAQVITLRETNILL